MADSHTHAPIPFAGFVLSLATSAAIHLGDVADPGTGQVQAPDLEAASQMIDLLAMLQEKTRGNLDADEAQVLEQILYDLRLRYVAVRDQKRIIVP